MSKLVAIVNVTPDSFSDGGKYNTTDSAIEKVRELIHQGADILDIGAESTRPGANTLSADEEWQRLEVILPAIIKIANDENILTSLDTRHAESAKKAIKLGIDWINDVNGLQDDKMVAAVVNSDVRLIMMHSLSVPANKNIILPEGCDPILVIKEWTKAQIDILQKHGINKDRVILDPGIGFSKNTRQSWEIIKRVEELQDLGLELFIGHSLKSFLGGDISERYAKTIALSKELAAKNIDYLRVHDIIGHKKEVA